MKKLMFLSLAIALLGLTSACEGGDRDDLKSPCVGAQGSPCDKRSVNDWWLA